MADDRRRELRKLMWLLLVCNLLLVAVLATFYLALSRRSVPFWILFGAIALSALMVFVAIFRQIVARVGRRMQAAEAFRESGKLDRSYHESLIGRIVTDGVAKVASEWMRFCFDCSLRWLIAILILVGVFALIRLDVDLFVRSLPRVVMIALAIGFFVGTLIDLFGRWLRIKEGLHIALDIPGTRTFAWSIDELVTFRIIRGQSKYVTIELEFEMTETRRPSNVRVISRLSDEDVEQLRHVLDRRLE